MINKSIIISTSFNTGTITGYFHQMAQQFAIKDYKVIVLLDGKPVTVPDSSESLSYQSWPSKRPTKLKDFIFFYKLVRKERPIMCLSNFGSTNIISLVSYALGVPHRWNFVHTQNSQITIDRILSPLKSDYFLRRKKLIYRLNTLLLTNSSGTRSDEIELFKLNPLDVLVHTFLIDPSNIVYVERSERKSILLIVGRLSPSKGHYQLLDHFKELRSQNPDLKLQIVGDGSDRFKLERKVDVLQLQDHVDFIGNIPNKEINEYYRKALVHISASQAEAFGMVTIESLREGTPILCTTTSGSLDILKSSQNGEFYDIDNSSSFVESVQKILKDWDQYSIGALKSFDHHFSTTQWSNHLSILEKIIQSE